MQVESLHFVGSLGDAAQFAIRMLREETKLNISSSRCVVDCGEKTISQTPVGDAMNAERDIFFNGFMLVGVRFGPLGKEQNPGQSSGFGNAVGLVVKKAILGMKITAAIAVLYAA